MKLKDRLPRRLKFPYRVSCGPVSATIYKVRSKNGYVFFQLADLASGRRRVRSFGAFEAARREADFQVTRLAKGEAAAAGFSASDAAALARARELLEPHGIEIEAGAAVLAEAAKILGSPSRVLVAANWFARHNIAKLPSMTVCEAVEELLNVKDTGGRSDRHLADLRHRLGRFSLAFGDRQITDVTTADLQRWLDKLKLSPQSRVNFRRAITNLFNHAARRGYLVRGENPADGLEKLREKRTGEVEIYTPQEFTRLLAAAPPDFVPCIAIGGLAGLRSSEIERLEWSNVDLVARHIVVTAQKSKTKSRRLVPICDTLAGWLKPFAGQKGLVWRGDHRGFYAAQEEASAGTEVQADPKKPTVPPLPPVAWKTNALRHSYGSYRLAKTGDALRVAFEMGNSPAVVHAHYKALVTASEGAQWFNTCPGAQTAGRGKVLKA